MPDLRPKYERTFRAGSTVALIAAVAHAPSVGALRVRVAQRRIVLARLLLALAHAIAEVAWEQEIVCKASR